MYHLAAIIVEDITYLIVHRWRISSVVILVQMQLVRRRPITPTLTRPVRWYFN